MTHPNLVALTADLRDALARLPEPPGVDVYNPLQYAWSLHRRWLLRYVASEGSVGGHAYEGETLKRRVLFIGMNPGPYGMMQTACPFGDTTSARLLLDGIGDHSTESYDWTGVPSYKRRRLKGFACPQREVSGQRFWEGLADLWPCERPDESTVLGAHRIGIAAVLRDAFVMNFCPLAYLDLTTRRNVTPDKLSEEYQRQLNAVCEPYLERVILDMGVETIIGVGRYPLSLAEALLTQIRCSPAADHCRVKQLIYMAHPSPSNPAANRGWTQLAADALRKAGIL